MSNGQVQPPSPNFAVREYPFLVNDVVRVQIPQGARLLHVGQRPLAPADMQLWAEVDKRAPTVERVLVIYGTDHDMPAEPGLFVGTVLLSGGLALHVYDAGEVR